MDVPGDIDLHTVVARSDKLLHSTVDDDVTMLSVETGKYYSLTAVGARVWAFLEQPMSAAQICDRLMTEYRVDRAQCEAEVLSLFRVLVEQGVVTTAVRAK